MKVIRNTGLFILLLSLTGCGIQPLILEDIQLVTALGYDYAGNGKVKATYNIPITPFTEDSPPENESISAVGSTSKITRQILQSRSSRPLHIGRMAVVLYGKKLAQKQGIFGLINTLERDPELGRDLWLGVVDGKVETILGSQYPWEETTSKYIEELIGQNERQNIPHTNLHDFLFRFYGEGMDPFMPLLEKNGDEVTIKGMALFKGDHYVEQISLRKSFIMKVLFESFNNGIYQVKLKHGNHLALENLSSKVDYHVKYKREQPQITIEIDMKGKINEFQTPKIISHKVVNSIEDQIRKSISIEAVSLVHEFQQLRIDPLGLGHRVNNETRNFDIKRWNQLYPHVPIDIKVNFQVEQTGISE